jgi:hypothetical protein
LCIIDDEVCIYVTIREKAKARGPTLIHRRRGRHDLAVKQ